MAFPVPDHLPKRQTPVDVSSKILYKLDAATRDTLNSSLSSSWLQELDESILNTKQRIHDRIQEDLPLFQQQLQSSKSVQLQYESLSNQLDNINDTISNPKTGLLPVLLQNLTEHSILQKRASDAQAISESLSYILRCRNLYSTVHSLVQEGRLPEAVSEGRQWDQLLQHLPEGLSGTAILADFKSKFAAVLARAEDQLNDAYSRAVQVSPTVIHIRTSVEVRQTSHILDLESIFSSLSPLSLSNSLSTLRRNLQAHFFDHVLRQPFNISIDTSNPHTATLSLTPAPPNNEDVISRIDNVSHIIKFLNTRLFPYLPGDEASNFPRSLGKPITQSILNNLLIPSLPSSFGLLPGFLKLLKRAVTFEETEIQQLIGNDWPEDILKSWSTGVSGHYERRRRTEILELARKEILQPDDPKDTFKAISDGGLETSIPTVVPIQIEDDVQDDAWGFDEPMTANEEKSDKWEANQDVKTPEGEKESGDSWGFDEPSTPNGQEDAGDSWGFDDDIVDDTNLEPEPEPVEEPSTQQEEASSAPEPEVSEPDPADAWGWNDDETPSQEEEAVVDDPWDDPWGDTAMDSHQEEAPKAIPAKATIQPKAATRLEKMASKHKKIHSESNFSAGSPAVHSQPPEPTTITLSPPSPKAPEPQTNGHSRRQNGIKRPPEVVTTIAPKEYYDVPKRAKRIIRMIETVIDESKLFYASNLFPDAKDVTPAPGTILVQSASSILDLFEALYPVTFAEELESPEQAILFSNCCLYMAGAVQRVEDTLYGQNMLKERLTECRNHLQILGDSWFADTIDRERKAIDTTLVEGAQGFMYTGNQDQYDECETAVNQVLKDIKRLAPRLKAILTKSKYYTAIGSIVDAALSRVLHDVLALPDIPEVESHRLSELCRILNSLEVLFSEDPTQPSFVVAYVPNWLKFSYLSELLEASLADITYLFEQGALVDFQVDELVALVRALFADTVLRTNAINKVLAGHPISS
ncbi:hypothetical protein CVT24_008590 [Panaeolus cyanescens]|uniref:ZW10 C-terminal helical domain-containing protein n=1 Tax=Panaeolus cyanescens TaxID=181874 RepID=A0A409VB84_9AGAR|nr:hypothetical protein CVT24_008590 [Panaeolus cyanescens]